MSEQTLLTSDLADILSRVTYRPGWEFTISDQPEGPMLRIIAPCYNAYRPDEPLTLGIDTYPSPNDTRHTDAFLRFLSWRLRRIESHESREWLRFDGETVFDPHKS